MLHQSKCSTLRFPPSFVFYSKLWTSTSYIGTNKDSNLFAVDTGTRFNLRPRKQIVLYDGPNKSSPILAFAEPEKGNTSTRCLVSIMVPRDSKAFNLIMTGNRIHSLRFSIPIDGADEDFEWRCSTGSETELLSQRFDRGWSLIRLGDARQEVVAVGSQPRSWRKLAPFGFVSAGATGELGEVFEIVAVISYLRLYTLAVDTENERAAALAVIL